jgi:hypothetical protein
MKFTLTNQQIENAFLALQNWNPPVIPYKAKIQLARNHRKLAAAFNDKEQERLRLVHSHVKDGSKKPEAAGVQLTPDEWLRFQPEYKRLMAETQDVEIQPQEIYRSDETDPLDPESAIDLTPPEKEEIELPNNVGCALIDVVLFEHGDPILEQALAEKRVCTRQALAA